MTKTLRDRIAEFAPTELTFDERPLNANIWKVLQETLEVSRLIAVLPVDIEPLFPIEQMMRDW